jgi:sugar lactone lactonase YvrE
MVDVACVANTDDVLGEVPRWHASEQALYWIDAFKPALHRVEAATGQVQSWTPPEKLGSFALSTYGALIIAGRNGFALYDPRSGGFERIADPENQAAENILNDGRCDSRGRFWCGSMTKTMKSASGRLYRVDKGRVAALDDTIWISNGIAWSPDGKTMYFADSHVHTIFAYDYDVAEGRIGERRVFAETSGQPGIPDGASVDAEGFLWSAGFGGGCLVRYAPDGRVDRTVLVPISQPTACAFGGSDLRTLYVTTARFRLAPEKRASETHAGALLALDVGVKGLVEPFYAAEHHSARAGKH